MFSRSLIRMPAHSRTRSSVAFLALLAGALCLPIHVAGGPIDATDIGFHNVRVYAENYAFAEDGPDGSQFVQNSSTDPNGLDIIDLNGTFGEATSRLFWTVGSHYGYAHYSGDVRGEARAAGVWDVVGDVDEPGYVTTLWTWGIDGVILQTRETRLIAPQEWGFTFGAGFGPQYAIESGALAGVDSRRLDLTVNWTFTSPFEVPGLVGETATNPLPVSQVAQPGVDITSVLTNLPADSSSLGPVDPNHYSTTPVTVVEGGYGNVDTVYIDPELAVGFGFTTGGTNQFRSFEIPFALPQGDETFMLAYGGVEYPLTAGEVFDFTNINPDGVESFVLLGIDERELIDANGSGNPPFVFGATFVKPPFADITTFALASTESSAVPEPSSLTLFGMGMLTISGYGWRRRQICGRRSLATASQRASTIPSSGVSLWSW